ncbi:MAG: hypothetical protein IBJ10_05510 [Phycisphaerales bacterium]|nr:hypothetical protein [Phycisphaerales bacterium]
MNPRAPLRSATLLPVLALALAGCDASPQRAGPGGPAARGAYEWPFGAARIEVHPLTRLVRDPASPGIIQIEAHVEMFDRWGHGAKDVGVLRFELYRAGRPDAGAEAEPRQQLVWTLDLTDPRQSSARFDPITRTYVVPLDEAPDWSLEGAPPTLLVQFTTPDGRRLTATRRLD